MTPYKWRFFRAGGFDQVSLENGADLLALKDLDQKLWVTLSCPVKNLEFDDRVLKLLDSDQDGHIRAPEILEAVAWAGALLKDPETLIKRQNGLPLAAINDATPEGKILLDSARHILENLGKKDADTITVEDTDSEERIFAQMRFNGDGIIPPETAADPALKAAITDIIDCLGGQIDRSGAPGVSQDTVDRFFTEARAYADWFAKIETDPSLLPLAASTPAAFEALNLVRDKINDYFTRCRLAAFDGRCALLLNPAETDYQKLAPLDLSRSNDSYISFPLAIVEADKPLPLREGINPAWSEAVTRFREVVVAPLLGVKESLSAAEWESLDAKFARYGAWHAAKPETSLEKLGIGRVRELLDNSYKAEIDELISRDQALAPQAKAISSVERLVRYCRYLHVFINNFVSFRDFYRSREKAVFQAGTLYLDGRSCDLCVKVDDVGTHVTLASLSRVYLVYCNCARRGGSDRMTIAAAFTAGDSDQLMVGRNGLFYDRKGRDWDATIVRIVEHPISVRQAFWSPYKQLSKLLNEQLLKLASARSKATQDKIAATAVQAETQAAAGKAPAEKTFDVGKFAGIFAAIGLAVGAIGTAIASMMTGLLRLPWWQWPLVIIVFILAISGPSMIIAWFKLRQRNLGPILDANGWAVNARAKINIKFGTSLTGLARLPEGAEKPLTDIYADKKSPWGRYILLAILIAALIVIWWYSGLSPLPGLVK